MISKNFRKPPTFIDLFAGCGGLSLGFQQAGYRCIIAIDNDTKAIDCYNYNLSSNSDIGAVYKDVNTFTTKKDVIVFLKQYNINPSACDVLIGGPPCQSYSIAGINKIRSLMQMGDELAVSWDKKNKDRVSLSETYALFIEVLAPRWFIFENVPTISKHDSFRGIIERFNNLRNVDNVLLNYKLSYNNYVASYYKVPQNRKRFILVGYREDLEIDEWKPPEQSTPVTVQEALNDLPAITSGHRAREMIYSSIPATEYQKLMRLGDLAEYNAPLFDHIGRWHNPDDIALFKKMRPGARFADSDVQAAIREINPEHKLIKYSTDKYQDKLHKLDPCRPAWTVTAHLQKDCYKFIHYSQPRTITVREAARLQSFPDWFRFDNLTLGSSFRLIGNAVPPLMAQRFAESFIVSDVVFQLKNYESNRLVLTETR